MTDTQINAAIADACGWTVELSHLQSGIDAIRDENRRSLPNYSTDLNAMHEAESILTTDQFYLYSSWIDKLAPKNEYRAFLGATARLRAEAFLRTLGKWEEVQK